MLRERPRAYLTSVFVISLALTSISVLEQKTSPVAPNRAQFNSVPAVADLPTHTGNPYVNAGAIATVSLISGRTADEKWNKVLNFYSRAAGETFAKTRRTNPMATLIHKAACTSPDDRRQQNENNNSRLTDDIQWTSRLLFQSAQRPGACGPFG